MAEMRTDVLVELLRTRGGVLTVVCRRLKSASTSPEQMSEKNWSGSGLPELGQVCGIACRGVGRGFALAPCCASIWIAFLLKGVRYRRWGLGARSDAETGALGLRTKATHDQQIVQQ